MTAPVPLGELAEIVSGGTPKRSEPSYFGGDIPWVKIGDMMQGTVVDTEERLTKEGLMSSSAKVLPAGTLLLSIFATIGRTAVLGRDAATNQAIAGLKIRNPNVVDRDYLRRYLSYTSGALAGQGRGVAQPNINLSILRAHPIPLPVVSEQRRIAAVLDAADALRATRRVTLERLETLPKALFYKRFENDWDRYPSVLLGDLAAAEPGAIRTGPFGSQLLHEEFVESGVAVLGIDNVVHNRFTWGQRRFITEEKYGQLRRYTVHAGDVLVTIMGTCGRVAVVPSDLPCAINTKHLCCITLDQEKCAPEWLQACLLFHPRVLKHLGATHGAVMPGLNMGLIKDAEIPLPPIQVQNEFARAKRAIDRQVGLATDHLGHLDALFGSLAQRAFRGEL